MDGRSTLDVLRAAYRMDVDDGAWVEGVARAIAPALDVGLGVQTFVCDLRGDQPALRHARLDGGTHEWAGVWRENWLEPHIASLSRVQLAQVLAFAPVSRANDLWEAVSRAEPTYGELLRRLAREGWSRALCPVVGETAVDPTSADKLFYPDSLNLIALDPSGVALAIVANRGERARPGTSFHDLERLGGVAAHLTAALRLRMRHPRTTDALNDAEVVFDRAGRVVHAEGAGIAGRESLTAAVSARSSASSHDLPTAEVLARWRALHEGRWSLVDVEEPDGKAWTLACPNAPRAVTLERITHREREVVALLSLGRSNKAIAYELGISSSTVATLVARARWKLGAKTVSELVRLGRDATLLAARVDVEASAPAVAVGAAEEPRSHRKRLRSGERPRVVR